jgi:hypothetical protein
VVPEERAGSVRYELGERAANARARTSAFVGSGIAAAPLVMVVIVLRKLGYPLGGTTLAIAGALGALLFVRGYAEYVRVRSRLRLFHVEADETKLVVVGRSARLELDRSAIERIVAVDGPLGGLRVLLKTGGNPDAPSRVDVPKGGQRFAELRERLASWAPIERAGRRSRATRIVLGVLVVVGIFFLPFVFDDFVARSKVAAFVVILGVWLAMRVVARR